MGTALKDKLVKPELERRTKRLWPTRAAKETGVGLQRLQKWIEAGALIGTTLELPSGRTQIAVRKGQEHRIAELNDTFNLADASIYIGLPERRLRELLEADIIRGAAPAAGAQWRIERTVVEEFMTRVLNNTNVAATTEKQTLSLNHILRFRWHASFHFCDLIKAMCSGIVLYSNGDTTNKQLSALLIDVESFNRWTRNDLPMLTVVEMCERLSIKQEVGYHLVNKHIVESVGNGRIGARVTHLALENFKRDYCFGREIAQTLRTSPKAAVAKLNALNILPVVGPTVDGCRQYLYQRSNVKQLFESCSPNDESSEQRGTSYVN